MCHSLRLTVAHNPWINTSRSALLQLAESTFENVHGARAYSDTNGQNCAGFLRLWVEICILQSHLCCGVGELCMSCHSPWLPFRIHVFEWVETLYFAGDAALEVRRIKQRNRADAAAPGQNRFPKWFNPDSIRS